MLPNFLSQSNPAKLMIHALAAENPTLTSLTHVIISANIACIKVKI